MAEWKRYGTIGVAGMVGALLRYYTGVAVHPIWGYGFPLSTFLVNVLGCFILTLFMGWTERRRNVPAWFTLGFSTGFVGSFTTFSAFSVENAALLREGRWGMAVLYVLLSLWAGLAAAWAGYRLGIRQTT